jgi:hypothetical protein
MNFGQRDSNKTESAGEFLGQGFQHWNLTHASIIIMSGGLWIGGFLLIVHSLISEMYHCFICT